MAQKQEQRHIYYDADLKIEAYNLSGIVQKFPRHFHEHYVVGFIEGGRRHVWCGGREYDLLPGDLVLFNPHDHHFCVPVGGDILDYRAVNIPAERMAQAVKEIFGKSELAHFTRNAVRQTEAALLLASLYDAIVQDRPRLEKEEAFYFLLRQLLSDYAVPVKETPPAQPDAAVQTVRAYLDNHFADNITLDELAAEVGLSKYYLLRCFTRQIGISPYRYLQSIRIERAKKLLEQGTPPIQAACMTGFSDQSHFTRFFKEFNGLTPKQYQNIFTETTPEERP